MQFTKRSNRPASFCRWCSQLRTWLSQPFCMRACVYVCVCVPFGSQTTSTTSSGIAVTQHVCDAAVVAVPAGVLKRGGGGPKFSPPMPNTKLAAIEELGFGVVRVCVRACVSVALTDTHAHAHARARAHAHAGSSPIVWWCCWWLGCALQRLICPNV